MIPNIRLSHLVLAGLLCASLAACGSSAPTPSATVASSAPSPSSAAATTTPSARPTPSPAIGGVCTPAPVKFDPKATIDLTGAWAGDDGGVVYVRQRGNVIWWNSMSDRAAAPVQLGRGWNNVGRGEIKSDLTIAADWVDVPRGGIDGYGTVDFKIGPDAAGNLQITKTSETGTGRGDTVWTRCKPGFYSAG